MTALLRVMCDARGCMNVKCYQSVTIPGSITLPGAWLCSGTKHYCSQACFRKDACEVMDVAEILATNLSQEAIS